MPSSFASSTLTNSMPATSQSVALWHISGSASQLLIALSRAKHCFGLCLLYDQGNPVIACQPHWAVRQSATAFNNPVVEVYQLQPNGQYNCKPTSQSFEHTLKQYWQQNNGKVPLPATEPRFSALTTPPTRPLMPPHTELAPESQPTAELTGFNGGLMGVLAYPANVMATPEASAAIAGQGTIANSVSIMGHYTTFIRGNGNQLSSATLQWTLYALQPQDADYMLAALCAAGLAVSPCSTNMSVATYAPAAAYSSVAVQSAGAVVTSSHINPTLTPCALKLNPVLNFGQYRANFARIQDYILAGDCYQINYTMPFIGVNPQSLLSQFDSLWAVSPAPFFAYYTLHAPGATTAHEVLSCSPELFLRFSATGQVITEPIKGTRPRSNDPIQDAKLQQALRSSEKDIAENIMIVDLLRNDLSKYAQVGSVRTTALCALHSFALVHHLVSTVQAQLLPDASALDVLFAAFPGGSITGAPKVRAMQIIDQLESASRGVYCGSIGYINPQGSGRFNIAIRTFEQQGNQVQIWVGGGITAASTAQDEWQECMHKVRKLLDAVAGIS